MTRTETNEANLKSLSTIAIKGLPGNPTIPEDKALKAILESVNKSLHGHLNDLCKLYTKNVCTNRNTEEMIDQVKTAVSEVASTCSPSPSYVQIASATPALPISAHTTLARAQNKFRVLIKTDRIVKLRDNGIMIESTSKEIETLLDGEKLKEAKLEARKPKKMWPKAVIYNVPLDIEEEELKEKLKSNCKNMS
ncbi:hypothetical protein GEV33_003334 [Tenebrio molitor]|uniref:Uncharacterized protein n=1 Tax=Tenebrio molitor TaxID=7067 RepID=A0A8J6LHW7_TENMO|nr:hypothetical protein GEV33_003334 [Tenebrio molitor]